MPNLIAQSLLEYSAITVLVEGFTDLWLALWANLQTWNAAWLVLPVVLYLFLRKKR